MKEKVKQKPTKDEIRRVMSFIGSRKTPKRIEASRKSIVIARNSQGFKYRKLTPESVADIRANCPREWNQIKEFAKKHMVHPTMILRVIDGARHANE